jgi:hypothetical protein
MCLYSSGLMSISADWMALNTSSAMPKPSTLIWNWFYASVLAVPNFLTNLVRVKNEAFMYEPKNFVHM